MKLAIIPARGGSTRIPRKNIREFHGKPIIAHSIATAQAAELFDHIIVSTDDAEIAEIAMEFGATDVHKRDPSFARNDVGTQAVAQNVLQDGFGTYPSEYACVIYATAPLMMPKDLRAGYNYLRYTDMDYVYSVSSVPNGTGTIVKDAGQWYWGTTKAFREGRPLAGPRTSVWVIPQGRVCDINVEDDWKAAEILYSKLRTSRRAADMLNTRGNF